MRRGGNHLIRQQARFGSQHAQPKARIDQRIVRLPDNMLNTLISHTAGRNARGHQRLALRPDNQILRGRLGKFSRIAQREDDRALAGLAHQPDDVLGESARLRGRAHQNGRSYRTDDFFQIGQLVCILEVGALPGKRPLLRCEVIHVVEQQALPVDHIEMVQCFLTRQAFAHHLVHDSFGDARTCRTGAIAQVRLVGQLVSGDVQRTENAGQGHDAGALDVIVECGDDILVLVQDGCGVFSAEILPMQVQPREEPFGGPYEPVDERVVPFAPDAFVPCSQIQRVVEQLPAVGAGVDDDGQH